MTAINVFSVSRTETAPAKSQICAMHPPAMKDLSGTPTADNIQEQHTKTRKMLSVSFSTIEIREYPLLAGDNPSVSCGVPITIDWTPLVSQIHTLDEHCEAQDPVRRRSETALRLPSSQRTELLRQWGVSRTEILKATKSANISRHRRRRTRETLQLAPAQEFCESVSRILRRVVASSRVVRERERILRESYRTQPPQVGGGTKTVATMTEDDDAATEVSSSTMEL